MASLSSGLYASRSHKWHMSMLASGQWPPQFHASMFKQLYLSEILFDFASENINACISPFPIHEYIQNKFLTCSREVADPILSQNIHLKYVVPNAKQK